MTLDRRLVMEALPAYEIGDEIGRGGWGVVLSGRHRQLGREVAIKQLPRAFAVDPAVRERFLDEARTVASLDHPHIVPVYDYVDADGLCLIVMELMPGGTLWDRFQDDGYPVDQACGLILAGSAALHAAHSRGILHRDVKPENFLFTARGVMKLGDFGIAKLLDTSARRRTMTGQIIGTPAYMAPEQASGDQIGPPTDVYAVSVMLYELLTGVLPFPETDEPIRQLLQRLTTAPQPVTDTRPDIPRPIAAAIMKGLATDPADRYDTAEAFGEALATAATVAFGPGWLLGSGVEVLGAPSVVAITSQPVAPAAPDAAAPKRRVRPTTVYHGRLGDDLLADDPTTASPALRPVQPGPPAPPSPDPVGSPPVSPSPPTVAPAGDLDATALPQSLGGQPLPPVGPPPVTPPPAPAVVGPSPRPPATPGPADDPTVRHRSDLLFTEDDPTVASPSVGGRGPGSPEPAVPTPEWVSETVAPAHWTPPPAPAPPALPPTGPHPARPVTPVPAPPDRPPTPPAVHDLPPSPPPVSAPVPDPTGFRTEGPAIGRRPTDPNPTPDYALAGPPSGTPTGPAASPRPRRRGAAMATVVLLVLFVAAAVAGVVVWRAGSTGSTSSSSSTTTTGQIAAPQKGAILGTGPSDIPSDGPSISSVVAGDPGKVVVNWTDPTGVANHLLEIRTPPGTKDVKPATTTAVTVDLAAGQRACFVIRQQGVSSPQDSNPVCVNGTVPSDVGLST